MYVRNAWKKRESFRFWQPLKFFTPRQQNQSSLPKNKTLHSQAAHIFFKQSKRAENANAESDSIAAKRAIETTFHRKCFVHS